MNWENCRWEKTVFWSVSSVVLQIMTTVPDGRRTSGLWLIKIYSLSCFSCRHNKCTYFNSHTVLIMLSENFYNINGLFVPLKIFGDLNISQAVDNSLLENKYQLILCDSLYNCSTSFFTCPTLSSSPKYSSIYRCSTLSWYTLLVFGRFTFYPIWYIC